jgi:hypothetical protein
MHRLKKRLLRILSMSAPSQSVEKRKPFADPNQADEIATIEKVVRGQG